MVGYSCPTCQYGLVRLELTAAHRERHIAEFLVIEEIAEIFGELALGHFELHYVGLSGDVHAVRHDADLAEDGQLVLGQEAVGLVQKKVAAYELLKAPIFALHETVSSVNGIKYYIWDNLRLLALFWTYRWDSIALVSSRFAFSMENLNLALTSDLLHETNSKYNDK